MRNPAESGKLRPMSDAAQLTITIDQGTVWRRKLVFASGTADDAPRINLTGCVIEAQVRTAWNRPLVKQMTVEAVDLAEGEIIIVLDDTARELGPRIYFWDLLITFPTSDPKKYLEGPVIVKKTITRAP